MPGGRRDAPGGPRARRATGWLVTHPEIHTICRDRNGRDAKAARTGAPAAIQVADRFHLVQNLRDTIERELSMQRAHLRVEVGVTVGPPSSLPAPAIDVDRLPVCVPGNPRERRLLPARRLAIEMEIARQRRQQQQPLFDRVKVLQAAGLPMNGGRTRSMKVESKSPRPRRTVLVCCQRS